MAPSGGESERDVDVLLKDGSTAHIRPIRPDDGPSVVAFHGRLSAESIRLRFFTPHPTLSEQEISRVTHLCGPDDLALVALRGTDIVAMAEYDRSPESEEAEVAFVVDDAYQGRGLSTILLERLAAEARRFGIRRFVAHTLWENRAMIGVLHDAGFAHRFSHDDAVVSVVLDISPSPEAVAAADERDRLAVVRSMDRLLRPRSIAVVGARDGGAPWGTDLVTNLVTGGFEGPVYPVNPSAAAVASVPCWPGSRTCPAAWTWPWWRSRRRPSPRWWTPAAARTWAVSSSSRPGLPKPATRGRSGNVRSPVWPTPTGCGWSGPTASVSSTPIRPSP